MWDTDINYFWTIWTYCIVVSVWQLIGLWIITYGESLIVVHYKRDICILFSITFNQMVSIFPLYMEQYHLQLINTTKDLKQQESKVCYYKEIVFNEFSNSLYTMTYMTDIYTSKCSKILFNINEWLISDWL